MRVKGRGKREGNIRRVGVLKRSREEYGKVYVKDIGMFLQILIQGARLRNKTSYKNTIL